MKKNFLTCVLIGLILGSCKKEKTTQTNNPGSGSTVDNGPVLNLEFNNNFIDSSAVPTTITNNGCLFTADRNTTINKAVDFNGSSSISMPNISRLQPAFPFTISFWVSVNDSSDWAHNYFMQSNVRPNGAYCGYLIRCNASGAIHFTAGDTTNNSTIDATSSIILRSNLWTHYTAVVKGNNNVELYFNGTLDTGASVSGTGTAITYPSPSSAGSTGLIGGVGFLTNNGRLQGKMDKVKIWKRALSSSEILSEYNNQN